MTDTMDKHTLRQIIKEQKKRFSADQLIEQSMDITLKLEKHHLYHAAHTVLLYNSMPDEVNTHGLIASLHKQGRCVLLPRMKNDEELELVRYKGKLSMRMSEKFNILEPEGEPFTQYESIDLAIIPGVAFTLDGERLGRGKGYYDRLLAKMPSVYKMGLCFPFQVLDAIPTDENDVLMDVVFCLNNL